MSIKLISWNVNGLRACMEKGFETIFNTLDADIFCLQETKLQPDQLKWQTDRFQLLELRRKERIFRHSRILQNGAAFRFLWAGNR